MTKREADQYNVGDRVHFHGDETDQGTVLEVGFNAVKIEWDNGQIGVTREAGDIHPVTR